MWNFFHIFIDISRTFLYNAIVRYKNLTLNIASSQQWWFLPINVFLQKQASRAEMLGTFVFMFYSSTSLFPDYSKKHQVNRRSRLRRIFHARREVRQASWHWRRLSPCTTYIWPETRTRSLTYTRQQPRFCRVCAYIWNNTPKTNCRIFWLRRCNMFAFRFRFPF